MINLCPTTFEIASKMKNFSGWVRQELLKQQQEQQEKEDNYTRYRCPSCLKVFVDRYNFGEMHCMNRDCSYTDKLEPIK
jgi:ribosomal protein L37AE/L43A